MPQQPSDNPDLHHDPIMLGEATWPVAELAAQYPPDWTDPNKEAVATIATPTDTVHEGSVTASRWQGGAPPPTLAAAHTKPSAGFFTYPQPASDDSTVHWHMNFADPVLFGYGEGSLLAQDELQIAEHPCLASLAYAIEEGRHGAPGLLRETERDGEATPVLVEGAPRRCALDTTHIYGDHFARAEQDEVEAATRPLVPPTRSNILALAALPPSAGTYTRGQIEVLLRTAYTGFRSAVLRSGRVTLHTGHWGCGAFGGNKGLVGAVQLLAAGSAGVEHVRFWWGTTPLDETALDHSMQVAQHLVGSSPDEAIDRLTSAGYRWGQANENHIPFEAPEHCLLGR